VYCESVLGREFARIDNFSDDHLTSGYWDWSPTNVLHLPQNVFESILKEYISKADSLSEQFENVEAIVTNNPPNTTIIVDLHDTKSKTSQITCDYLVAADGAHSTVRKILGIKMKGKSSLQTLLNGNFDYTNLRSSYKIVCLDNSSISIVQFRCRGLSRYITSRPAMLYFTFNEVNRFTILHE
jgi:2-polyprenyl-6-methoxyphenol hydroxylase-like FAD-dependent oxidoreductase